MNGTEQAIADLLTITRWRWTHTFPLRTKNGWRTPTTSPGWPDFLAVRADWMVAIEAKEGTGRTTEDQRVWLTALSAVPHVRAWVIRPDDLQTLAGWLARPRDAPDRYGFTLAP